MPVKLDLNILFDYNCQEWSPYEIECSESIMTIKCVTKDKLHLRIINELHSQKADIETLKQIIEGLRNGK